MKIIVWSWLTLFVLVAAGCYKEDSPEPSLEPEAIYGKYTLPQGNHDYDSEISEIYRKYGTLMLYRFEDKDFWWAVSSDIRWKYQEGIGTVGGYEATPADERYVGQQLELIKSKFLNYFPESFLNKALPLKMLLMSDLNYVPSQDNKPTDEARQFRHVYWGYDYLGVNWGNENILTMTAAERNAFKSEICYLLLENFYKKTNESPVNFFSISSYASGAGTSPEDGFIDASANTPEKDWLSFIKVIVSTPYEDMDAYFDDWYDFGFGAGKVRQKYNIVIDFFKQTYQIDLQAIGNDVE